jgi:hypothetical protein
MAQHLSDQFFNPIKPTILSKTPKAPPKKPAKPPRTGPPFKPPKAPAFKVPKQAQGNVKPSKVPPPPVHLRGPLGAQGIMRSQAKASQNPVPHLTKQLRAEGAPARQAHQQAKHIAAHAQWSDWTVPNLVLGPTLTQALRQRSFSPIEQDPLGGALDIAGVFPGLKLFRGGAEVADLLRAGEELKPALKGGAEAFKEGKRTAGVRFVHVGGGVHVAAEAPKEFLPRAINRLSNANLQRVLKAGEKELGPGYGLARRGKVALGTRIAERHVSNLLKREGFYTHTADRAAAKMLANSDLNDTEHLALRAVARGVMPHVTMAENENRIRRLQAIVDSEERRVAGARGKALRIQKIRAETARARDGIHNLTEENKILPAAERLVHDVPVSHADLARYPTHADHVGNKVQLRDAAEFGTSALPKSAARRQLWLHGFWDMLREESQKAEHSAIRMGDLTPAQAELRKHMPGRLDLGGAAFHEGEDALSKGHQNVLKTVRDLQAKYDASVAKDAERVGKGTVPKQAPGMQAAGANRLRKAQEAYEQITKLDSKWASAPTSKIEARIKATDDKWNEVVDKIKNEVPARKVETAKRNAMAGKRARKGLKPLKTVKQMEQEDAERRAWQLVSTHPELRHVRDQVAEADALKRLLEDRAEARAFGAKGVASVEAANAIRQGRKLQRNLPAGFQSTETRNLRGALNTAENRLARHEARFQRLKGYHPSTIYGTQSGIRGNEGFKGGSIYYPSKEETALARGGGGAYQTKSSVIPFRPRAEVTKQFRGTLQTSGLESPRIANIVGQQSLNRQAREFATERLAELRKLSIKGTIPRDVKTGELSKFYQAIRLTPQADPRVMERVRAVASTLEHGGKVTEEDAQALGKSLKELKDWYMPEWGTFSQHDPEIGYIHKAYTAALRDVRSMPNEEVQGLMRALGDVSQVGRDLMIYTKFPGHIPPRFMSNLLMALPDTGIDLIRGMHAGSKLWKNHPELARWTTELSGSGYYKAYGEGALAHKIIQSGSRKLTHPIETAADRPIRTATVLAMAMKQGGVRDYKGLVHYLKELRAAEPGTDAALARRTITEKARQASGEYENLGPKMRKLGSIVFLLRWLNASWHWTGRFALRHPIMAGAAGAGTYAMYQPGNPIWNRLNIAGHNVQTAIPWSTPIENAEQLRTLASSKVPPLGESPGSDINPLILTLGAALFHRDIETGRDIKGNPLLGALQQYGQSTPLGALVAGRGSFTGYRLPKFLLGNYAPTSGPAGPAASTGGGRVIGSNKPGSITKAQHKAIMRHLHFRHMRPMHLR